jgi:hypothetical protein
LRLNFSILPVVSIKFFPAPVKKGWQFEHISTVNSPPFEDSVFQVDPHAQRNEVFLYSGCILGFIGMYFLATIFSA